MTNYERIHNMLPTELAETIDLIVHEAATHPKTFDGIRKKDILHWLGQNDDDLTEEQLSNELRRAEGMTKVAEQIIRNGELAFKTMTHMDEYGYELGKRKAPAMLSTGGDDS